MAKKRKKRKLVRVPIDKLKPHPRQAELFAPPTTEAVQALADDIEQHGLQNRLEITSDHRIICGHCRLEAIKVLDWDLVPCWVREDLEAEGEEAVERRLIEDNLNRRQLSRLAQARSVLKLFELEKGRRQYDIYPHDRIDARDRIGSVIGMSGKQLERYMKILEMPMEIQAAVERGSSVLPMTMAVKLAGDPEIQQDVARRIRKGEAPREVVEAYIAEKQRKVAGPASASRECMRFLRQGNDLLELSLLDGCAFAARSGDRIVLNECAKRIKAIRAAFKRSEENLQRTFEKIAESMEARQR